MSNPLQLRNSEPRIRDIALALIFGIVNAIRQNRLAATLAVFALVFTSFLAYAVRYDERPDYQRVLLPDIERAETNFLNALDNAEHAPNDVWRLQFFLTAHLKAKDALRVARSRYPASADAIAAHNELIRYYELANEEFSIIRTQMSVDEQFDYWKEWNQQNRKLESIRQRWMAWVHPKEAQIGRAHV